MNNLNQYKCEINYKLISEAFDDITYCFSTIISHSSVFYVTGSCCLLCCQSCH